MTTTNSVTTNVCVGCEKRMEEASNAMRRHAGQMNCALDSVRGGRLTEQERQDLKVSLSASFNEAESAWNAYREHLTEHGILPERR